MTLILQVAFVVAAALTWVAVIILGVGLWQGRQGGQARELPAGVAVQAALLFAGTCLVIATVTRGLGDEAVSDLLLYAAVFAFAAATLSWCAEGAAMKGRPTAGRLLQALSLALPIGAGFLAGIVGTP